jgi:hypothetical protein
LINGFDRAGKGQDRAKLGSSRSPEFSTKKKMKKETSKTFLKKNFTPFQLTKIQVQFIVSYICSGNPTKRKKRNIKNVS